VPSGSRNLPTLSLFLLSEEGVDVDVDFADVVCDVDAVKDAGDADADSGAAPAALQRQTLSFMSYRISNSAVVQPKNLEFWE